MRVGENALTLKGQQHTENSTNAEHLQVRGALTCTKQHREASIGEFLETMLVLVVTMLSEESRKVREAAQCNKEKALAHRITQRERPQGHVRALCNKRRMHSPLEP